MSKIDLSTADGKTEALRRMILVREFENTVRDRFADGEIPGFVHLSQGQEAVSVGVCGALTVDDYITSTHRAHGHSIAKGLDPNQALAELYGKESGYCEGKGGSMHVAELDEGMLGAQPIVGASAPLAVGAGITAQYQDADWVTVAFIGDGATAAGQVHEAFNFAATWCLPVVFVVENNLYSEGMRFDEQHNIEDIAEMAASYGIPGEIVDGQDIEAVHEIATKAKEHVSTEGPILIEAKTYRFRGHFEGDQQPYRTDDEVSEWQEYRDPIQNYKDILVKKDLLTEDGYDDLRGNIETIMVDATAFARECEEADPSAAYDDVFVETTPDIDTHKERLIREEPDWGTY